MVYDGEKINSTVMVRVARGWGVCPPSVGVYPLPADYISDPPGVENPHDFNPSWWFHYHRGGKDRKWRIVTYPGPPLPHGDNLHTGLATPYDLWGLWDYLYLFNLMFYVNSSFQATWY